jgi:hypothetical protein
MKKQLIKILTATVPLKVLRKIYITYSGINYRIKYGDSKFPRIITIEISSHCNRICSYCPNVLYPQVAKLMDEEVFNKVAERIGEIDYNGVVDFIFFSEPTLHPKLAKYIKKIKQHAPKSIPRISTNGDFLTEEKVKAFVEAGLDRIYVMRHNPTPEGWVENIEALSKKFPGIFVRMDIDQVEATEGLHDFNGLLEVKKHRGRHIVEGRARCQVHRHIAQILIDGSWNLCCVDYAKTKQFGSLLKNSILEIWNTPEFARGRGALEAGFPITEVCKTCTCLVERKPEHKRADYISRADAEKLQ